MIEDNLIELGTMQEFKDSMFNILKNYDSKACNLMISGGSIIKCLDCDQLETLDTLQWKIFFCDERCEEKHSNFKSASSFLEKIRGEVFPIKILANSEESAKNYEDILKKNIHKIDVCLLGIGENGHICSLWPNSESLNSKALVERVEVDCNASSVRITVTLCFINQFVKNLIFVIPPKNGKSKGIKKPDKSIIERLKVGYKVYFMKY
ncbi:uncharacterized protein VICG_00785 [Vittaforma corneae ATCC 50505]|uniref:Glucosamine/galactosamine-6-phosphate isomerase domain-containing protein n=1 Tax=Vittaforma corneae (strain ATCC 50505) TaxID=993615 RepID=L2GPB8_VITCO|nr:uncharacterized protein VICG_00785 [Vittaforma corneae ATCC 50505]ELA42142.1 hypothetical protein VICG_00785 [Vittaforma corneae ATCC 50505]